MWIGCAFYVWWLYGVVFNWRWWKVLARWEMEMRMGLGRVVLEVGE